MDRRAFMALLGLGPAFKRLVPAPAAMDEMTKTAVAIGETVTRAQREFWEAVFTLHFRERPKGFYATLPEEPADA